MQIDTDGLTKYASLWKSTQLKRPESVVAVDVTLVVTVDAAVEV